MPGKYWGAHVPERKQKRKEKKGGRKERSLMTSWNLPYLSENKSFRLNETEPLFIGKSGRSGSKVPIMSGIIDGGENKQGLIFGFI